MIKQRFARKIALVSLITISIACLFFSCEVNVGSLAMGDTVSWEVTPDGKYVQYKTNDESNQGYLKYSLLGTPAAYTNDISVTVMKKSGSSDNGSGMVFFYQDSDTFYLALVSANGRYCIKKFENSSSVMLQDWTSSSYVKTGYGVTNAISVKYEYKGTYGFYVNGEKLGTLYANATFSDGGKYGPAVTVGYPTRESFPGVPVDAYFAFKTPNEYPVATATSYRAAGMEMTGDFERYSAR